MKNQTENKQIIKPVFGTKEWASYTCNFINGCKHDCKYCYSKEMAIRFHRKTASTWKIEEVRENDILKKRTRKNGRIMFPSSHDIHPDNLKYSIRFLENILLPGNEVLIVTKPHYICIKEICSKFHLYKKNIIFRFTIGSASSKVLKFWEPGAPSYAERLKSLRYAYNNGFRTSISCEPMLDDSIGTIINDVQPFTSDYIWIGKANFLIRRLRMNGVTDSKTMQMAEELLNLQSDESILNMYNTFKIFPKIKWKESIKSVVGITISSESGLDI